MQMRSEGGVILVGIAAGVAIAVLPEGGVPLVALIAALIAGALLPLRPMASSVLVLVPTIIVAVIRIAFDSDRNVGAMLLATLMAVFVAAIVTHVSAGVVLRRDHPDVSP